MKKKLASLGSLLGASSAALATIQHVDGVALSVMANNGIDTETWSIDSSTTAIMLNRNTATTVWYGVQYQYGYASIYVSGSSGIYIARNGRAFDLLTLGAPVSANADLAFGSIFSAMAQAYSSNTNVTVGMESAMGNANRNVMERILGSGEGSGIIGFRFQADDGYDYGWANIDWSGNSSQLSLTIYNVTYSDAEGIYAGTEIEIIPEPESIATGLGALAMGAAGLSRWRKRKQAA